MVDYLIYEGEPIAVPALRVIAILSGNVHDTDNRLVLAKAYALFESSFGEAANVTSYNFPGHKGKIRWMKPSLDQDGKAFFTRETIAYGEGLRRYGYALEDFEEPALPYFAVEQRDDLVFFEVDLPVDQPQSRAFADAITPELTKAQMIWGVIGLGMFLPPYKSSLEFELGRSVPRYRTSIEITPSMVTDGLRREGSAHRWAKTEEPGIPDIGWKTFIGREFWPRIPEAKARLEAQPDVTVAEEHNALVVTAGDDPIWGDVNHDEDISAFISIAEALLPIRYPLGAAKAFMFGGDPGNARIVDRVEAYLGRYVPIEQ